MKLSTSCRKELEEAEGRVEILLKQNGKVQAEPYEPAHAAETRKRT
jgi:exonuclease VII small subunit